MPLETKRRLSDKGQSFRALNSIHIRLSTAVIQRVPMSESFKKCNHFEIDYLQPEYQRTSFSNGPSLPFGVILLTITQTV